MKLHVQQLPESTKEEISLRLFHRTDLATKKGFLALALLFPDDGAPGIFSLDDLIGQASADWNRPSYRYLGAKSSRVL